MIPTHITLDSLRLIIYMWIFEVTPEGRSPASIVVQSNGILFWTTWTQIALSDHLSNNLTYCFWIHKLKWNLYHCNWQKLKNYIYLITVGHYKELSTQRPGSPKNTTQQHDVSVQSTLDRRPIYYSQKMDPSSPNANSIMWTHTSLEIKFKSNRSYFKWT